jgi:hypothetical protein
VLIKRSSRRFACAPVRFGDDEAELPPGRALEALDHLDIDRRLRDPRVTQALGECGLQALGGAVRAAAQRHAQSQPLARWNATEEAGNDRPRGRPLDPAEPGLILISRERRARYVPAFAKDPAHVVPSRDAVAP